MEEILHYLEVQNLVNHGINYQPALVRRISSINSIKAHLSSLFDVAWQAGVIFFASAMMSHSCSPNAVGHHRWSVFSDFFG